MKKFLILGAAALTLLITVLVLSTCSNPFTAGLGEKVDLDAPQLEISSHRNGDAVGATFTLTGTAIDDGVIVYVNISLTTIDNVVGSAALNGEDWSFSYDSTGLSDGDHEFIISIKDDTDKIVSAKLLLTVDNNPPTVLVTVPAHYGIAEEFNKNITIKGDAADTTRVQDVEIFLYDDSTRLVIYQATATGTSSWYHTFDSEIVDGGLNGQYYLFVSAQDYSGNANNYFYHFDDILTSAIDPANLPNVEDLNESDYQINPFTPRPELTVSHDTLRLTTTVGEEMYISVNPNSDNPEFIFISPSYSMDPSVNVLGTPQRLSGFVTDDDGVNFATLEIAIWDFADNPLVDTPVIDWIAPAISGNQWTYTGALSDGDYQMELRVEDIYTTAKTSDPVAFRVSSFAPIIQITQPAQGSYVGLGSTTTIEVYVTGMGGTGTVELDPNGDDNYIDAITMVDLVPLGDNYYSVDLTDGVAGFTVIDGSQTVKFRAGTVDNYGTANLQITGDITSPTVTVEIPLAGDSVNGTINMIGTSSDNTLISDVYLWIEEDAAPDLPADFTTWNTPDGSDVYNWIYNIDTTTLNTGAHTIYVKAVDAAENESLDFSSPFIVDQESDRPIISLSNMLIGGTGLQNGLGRDASIIGLVEDDDSVDGSTLEVRIDIDDDGLFPGVDLNSDGDIVDENESEGWVAVSNPPGSNTRIVSWTHSLLNVTQGLHSMQIRVHDVNSDGVTFDMGTNPNYSEMIETQFIVDYGPPDLIITGPANGAIFNTGFSITGTASDANGVFDVEISIDGGAFTTVMDPADSGDISVNWNHPFTVDAGGADDGNYSYQIQATDMSGGKTTLDRQLSVDATIPAVVIELPGTGSLVNGDSLAVRGTASDNVLISTVYLAQGTTLPANPVGGDPATDPAYTALGSTYSWNYTLDTTAVNNTDADLTYYVSIVAEDGATNISTKQDLSFTINQGSDRPIIDFNDIDKTETAAANNVLVGATNLTGIIEDDDLMDPALFGGASIEINIDNAGWIPVSTPPASSGKVVVWKHDISALIEGAHTVRLRARDNQSDGTVGASSAAVEYTNNFNWGIEDAIDQSGVPFILNIGPPSITIDGPANYSYHNTDVIISGNATDANGVQDVFVSTDNGITWIDLNITPSPPSVPAPWSHTHPAASGDGTYSYLVRAIDAYGATGVENGQFTVDATIPVTAITLPSDGATVNGSLTISGTGGDNISLSNVYYHIALATDPVPAFPADYILLGGTYSWNDTVDTTALADNSYILRVGSEDAAGNFSTISSADFTVDQTSDRPVISFNSILEAGTFEDNLLPSSKQIAGNITDDDSVDVSTIQYQLYAEDGTTLINEDGTPLLPVDTWTSISGAPGSDTTLATWTHTFGAALTDGKYHIRLRSADTYDAGAFTGGGFGWDTSALVEFAVDTANPETTISPANGGYTNQNFAVSGTATDDGGIKRVEIQFNAEPVIQLYEDADLLAPFNTSQAWNTSYVIDTAGHGDDGVLNYVLTITDAYDKIKTYDRYVNVDTQVPVINSLTLVNNDAGTPAIVNGSILIQGAPIDYEALVNAIYIVTATAQPAEPGADPVAEGWTLLLSTTNIYHRFDSTDLIDLTAYTTYIVLEDIAGNRTLVTDYALPFTTTQSGNTPVITMNTADASLLTSGGSISGNIIDDDGVDVSTIEISIDGGGFIPVTSTSASDSTSVVFSHSLGGLAEQAGSYSIEIRAFDIGEDFADDTQDIAPVFSTSTAINIFIDDSDPTAGITQIDNGNATSPTLQGLYINDQFTITGTSADGVQITDVRAKLDITGDLFTTAAVINTGTNFDTWSWTRSSLPVFGADSVIMNLEVEDIHGKITPYNYTLLVDETVPNISITTAAVNPSTGSGAYNGTQIFRGTSSDNVQISTVYYIFDNGSNPSTTDPVTDSWNTATGTYSWNFSLDTVNDATFGNNTAVDSTVYLGVVSVDSAGNVSAVNNINFTINQGSDQPVLSVTQPTDGGLIESNKKVIGSLSDDDGLASLRIRIDQTPLNGDFVDGETYVNVSQPAVVSGVNINFEHDLSALSDGPYKIQLQAVDTANASVYDTTTSLVISFDIDTVAPTLTLDQITVQNRYGGADTVIAAGFNGSYINNDSTLDFSASDSSGVASVEVSTDGGTTWTSDTTAPYSYLLSVAGLSEGTNNITYRATDNRGKVTSKILTVIVDTGEPGITFSNPTGVTTAVGNDAPNVNGDVTIRGSVSDSSSISSVTIIGGIIADVVIENTGNTISWIGALSNSDASVTSDASGTYANTTYSYNTGDDGGTTGTAWNGIIDGDEVATAIWRFPIEVTSEDFAGNITTVTGFIDIDPDSDNPIVSIVSPANDASVSGTFLVNGTILDDDGTDYVELQFDFDDDTFFDDTSDSAPLVDLLLSNDLTAYGLPDSEINESTPIPLPAPNGSWSIALNASDFTLAKLATAGYTGNGFLSLRVVPFDINGLQGAEQIIRIYLDTTSPVIAGLDTDGTTEIADPTPAGSTLQKETITLRARFEDDKELLESSMLISLDGGATFNAINPAYITDQLTTAPYKYYIEIPIDTTAIDDPISALVGGNGLLSIQLSITDQTNKQNSESITYSVDNNLPTIHWNEDGSSVLQDLPFIGTPPNEIYSFKGNESTGAGDDAYKVLGAAIDSGTISGIDKVNVYYVKGGFFYSPINGASTAVSNSDIADDTGTPVSIPFTENTSYVITIDNRIEQGIFDQTVDIGDFDGFEESLKAKAGYDEWYSFFDTTQLPDGPLEIYAVAYDEAGNMSYTVADAQIANNPPSFSQVLVGASAGSASAYSGLFKITNSLYIDLDATDVEGINTSSYKATLIEKVVAPNGAVSTDGPALDTEWILDTSGIITIDVQETPTTAFVSGVQYTLQFEVLDTDGNIVTTDIDFWLDNNDSTLPKVDIYDFTQTHLGGLNGHLEEDGFSLVDGTDADVSGTIKITGTAWDDNTLSSVELSFDGGTSWFAVDNLDAGTPDPILGTEYTWDYVWDTTADLGIAADAGYNRTVEVRGTDGNANVGTLADGAVDPTLTVDIVPYITGISGTGLESGLLAYVKRSAIGRYPIVVGSTLTIDGYNLPGTTTDAFSIGGTTLTAGSATGSTQMTVPLLTTNTSGDIFVVTNSVSSVNNSNDNTLPQNEEDNSYNANLSDNREAVFWDVSAVANTSTVTEPAMHPNAGNTDFDLMYVKSGQNLFFNNGTEKKLTEATGLSGGALTYNDSGSLIFLFNHNAEWSFYDGSFAFTGSVQYGQVADTAAYTFTTGEDEAYNWNQNTNFGKLGIGNVNFYYTGENNVSENPIDYAAYSNVDLNRYENLKIRTVGNDALTRNYVAYFDTGAGESRSIIFYGFKTSTTSGVVSSTSDVYSNITLSGANESDAGGGVYANIDKFSNAGETESVALAGTQKSNNQGIATPRGRQEVTVADSGNDSSQFDLAVYEQTPGSVHYGFIAYFDETAQSLKITANESLYNADPTGTLGTWTTAQTIDTNAGADVTMAVDPDGGIHLAYQDVSSGYLKYAYLTYNAGTDSFAVVEQVFVDALFGAGANNNIVIRDFGGTDYRPVIVTYSSAYTGTRAPMRLSYPLVEPTHIDFAAGADSSTGAFLGNWETIALPAGSSPVNAKNFLFIDASNNAHLGYEASGLEKSTFLGF